MIGPIIVMGGILVILGLIVLAIVHAPQNMRTETQELFEDNFDDNSIDSDNIINEISGVNIGVFNDEFSSIDDYEYGIDIKDD